MSLWDKFKFGKGSNEEVKRHDLLEAPAQRDPKKALVKRIGQSIKEAGGGDFEESPVDLEEIQRAYHADSYIRRAVDKYASLMFKQGWDFNGRNDAAVEYVWTRLKLMEEGIRKPIDQLLTETAFDFVLYGNAYWVKARMKGSNSGATGVQATGYTGKQPIAGYFLLPAMTMTISRDDTGNITGYQQDTGGGDTLSFKPEDIVHFTYRRPTGRPYGVPMVYNVLDDVKILRQLEENVARLVYRNLFPLYQYQVGIDKPGFEATDPEIDEVREEIRNMPMDGALVVPERHKITVVGAEGHVIDAEPYLRYFRQRVFTGLGVSDSIMGIGDTANRSTSDNQAADLFDGVKEFQRIFTEQLQLHVINEILFEGGFDPTLNVDDEVMFFFEEIELDAKIKRENHIMQLFMQNGIDFDEMRVLMGRDPVKDESRLFANMFGNAVSTEGASAQSNNQDQPENQHGKQKSPEKPKAASEPTTSSITENYSQKVLTEQNLMVNFSSELSVDSYLSSMTKAWMNLTHDVTQMIASGKSLEYIKGMALELIRDNLRGKSRHYISSAMEKGMVSALAELETNNRLNLNHVAATTRIVATGDKYINRITDDVSRLIEKAYEEEKLEERSIRAIGALNSQKYRLGFIAKTELYRAYNYGRAIAAKESGLTHIWLSSEKGCDVCKTKQGEVSLADADLLDELPPHHTGCECLVKLNKDISEEV